MKRGTRALGVSMLLLLAVASGEGLSAADGPAAVLEWQFDSDVVEAGKWQGKSKFSDALEAGPRTPRYPDFGEKNQGQTIEQGIKENREMIRFAKAEGLKAQVTISAAFGCPFEGAVPPETVLRIASEMVEEEPAEMMKQMADCLN